MKKNSKYIQVIIFLSSFALLGFLLIQLYWAKNTFKEKKNNFHILFEICVTEIGDGLREKILNESNYSVPKIGGNILAIQNRLGSNSEFSETLKNISSSEKSISEKRKDLLRVINKELALNININLDAKGTGSVELNKAAFTSALITANGNASTAATYIIGNKGSALAVGLLDGTTVGEYKIFTNKGAGAMTVTPTNFAQGTSFALAQFDGCTCIWDGTNWYLVGNQGEVTLA